MLSLVFTFELGLLLAPVLAGLAAQGSTCSANNTRLDPGTHKLHGDCGDKFFCSGTVNGTCQFKQCRRDDFPFGYDRGDPLPPLCPLGSFCPDEGSACMISQTVGQHCQLNRNEQCELRLPDSQELQDGYPDDVAICLQGVCMYANATAGLPCQMENTTYAELNEKGRQVDINVIRDNCRAGFYCHPEDRVCEHILDEGQSCVGDRNCKSSHCDVRGRCAQPLGTPLRVPGWQSCITILLIIAGTSFCSPAMATTCLCMVLVHKRHRLDRTRETREYFYEQVSLRQNIIALHSSTRQGG
ncbi:hypothetical protein HYDPIDRAFT_98869 [Hydnomerulius pinastri MD-312]|uniref:Dickkopf N-terminal cysteine-rich domain-containing protein n=1 Tax=Hydnomerulius pinastri MD-312 TaxID=994086 RepID=A0A0C9VRA7_9AGAM|nr:hypothetical protein HYDPIDRAFT_98869 [Hydnomerulius pinastri MD-312]